MAHVKQTVRWEGVHCTMELSRPAPGVALIKITGSDIGEFEERPFNELAADLTADSPLQLFIDGRDTRGASIDVSNVWAAWLARHRQRLHRVTMLTGSKFIQMTAEFVRRYAELDDLMWITTDPRAFDAELRATVDGTISTD